ncbi:MAG: helix-turn-helix domain-containing protein [Prevotella sp.]|nr:helix-turn-helix domain-containing protein [Prevotella sp.]
MRKCFLMWLWILSCFLTISSTVYAGESDRLFKVFDASDGLADNGAQVIICTKTGRMVISSIGHINFYNGSSFDHIDAHAENIYELPKYTGHYHLYFDKSHHLWVKDKYQVTCVDLLTELFVSDVQSVLKEMGFNGKAEDLFVDDDGCLLLLSKNQLYNCKTKRSFPVRAGKNLLDVEEYGGQLLLLFYDDSSIEAFNTQTGRMEYIKTTLTPQETAKYNKSSVLFPDKKGFYQIRNGDKEAVLIHIDATTGEYRLIMAQPYHLNNMVLLGDVLYIPCEFGYWTYHTKTGEKVHYRLLKRNDFQTIDTDINDIAFDLQGGMWAGTEKQGLLYSKPYESPFKVYPWSDPQAIKYGGMLYEESLKHQETLPRRTNCSYHDSRGWTWHGSYTGLKLYKTAKVKDPIIYNADDGLKNNVIHSIVEDNEHNIWVSTSDGISVLMIRNDTVTKIVSYGQDDNVPTETFANGRAMKLDDGKIIMQSLNYVMEFDPASFHTTKQTNIKLYPKLIRLSVNGQTVLPGMELDGKVILNRSITRTKEVNLDYDQNTISLLFTGLNYFRPVQTYYRIRIKGYQDEWKVYSSYDGSGKVDERGMLHYPIIGIPPGKYTIELQASMLPDEWSVEPYYWELSINEPWWRMTIVYLTLGILLLGMLIANFIFYNRNTRMRLHRNNIEGSIIKRVKTFVAMCGNMEEDELMPSFIPEEGVMEDATDTAFTKAMVRVVPFVNNHQHFTMSMLAKEAQMDLDQFYEVMSSNLYKTPRAVVLRLRLQQVANQLLESEKTVDEIAQELHFASPDYMIASFYHQYRQTPQDYRASKAR